MNQAQKQLIAIAIQYIKGLDYAPHIIAKGKGQIAMQILKIAASNGIKIRKDTALATILSVLEIGDYIPLQTFETVAKILAELNKNQTIT
jgi:flagellar biosynthesis protein